AAAVLVAVSVGSYWYFRGGDKDGTGNDGTTVAGKNNKPAGPAVKPAYQHNQPKKGGGSETPVENKIPDHKFEPGPIVMGPENPPVKVPQPQQAPGTKTPPGDTVLAGLGKPADDGEPEAFAKAPPELIKAPDPIGAAVDGPQRAVPEIELFRPGD